MNHATLFAFVLTLIVGISTFAVFKLRQSRRIKATLTLSELKPQILAARAEWFHPSGKDQYLTQPQHLGWVKESEILIEKLQRITTQLPEDLIGPEVRELISLWTGKDEARTSRNEDWVLRQRQKHKDLFSSGMGYPLNSDQINAILYDEHRSLVVAGAGTGKTSTIVAKARWILAQGLTTPQRMRILAFNKDAATEVAERLDANGASSGVSSTFHALGFNLTSQSRGTKPHLTSLEDDKQKMQKFFRKCIDEGLKTPGVEQHIVEFLTFFRYPEQTPVPLEKSHEAIRWADGHDIRSLTGVKLRSNSEAIIANWLTLNSIEWQYEKNYEFNTATMQHGQYRPDFFLPGENIYIEHWACDKTGKLPPNWTLQEQEKYLAGMQWKRELHRSCGTPLIETFSDINGRRTIVATLEHALKGYGVFAKPLSDLEINALVMVPEVIDPTVTLTQNFLKLFRESGATLVELRTKSDQKKSARALAFFQMFEWMHKRYVDHLESESAIDFSDMIQEASEALRTDRAKLKLDYLLVDEFQDISMGRAQLIKAILEKNPSCRLVAVGDDWQSINRFTGSDIQVMVDFAQEFGHTLRTDLRETHRFGTKLLDATSKFIQMNPQQLKKNLVAAHADQFPAIEVISSSNASTSIRKTQTVNTNTANDGENSLGELLRHISENNESASVLVLGRYRFLRQGLEEAGPIPGNLDVKFSTVHKAKGQEADFTVVLDVVTGRYGFPSEIEDDPIMNLVLANPTGFPNAEERRVFYVALTRSRIKSYVLTDDHKRSSFIDELEGNDYEGLVIGSGASKRVANCPVCKAGRLQLRTSNFGPFYSCVSARCHGKASKCPYCGAGGFLRGDAQHTCLFCGKTAENCPNCQNGYLKHIPAGATWSAFDACSTNSRNPYYICFKRNAIQQKPNAISTQISTKVLAVGHIKSQLNSPPRFRLGKYEFREPDYRQIELWAKQMGSTTEDVLRKLNSNLGDDEFKISDGAIKTLIWDFSKLPFCPNNWVDGLQINKLRFNAHEYYPMGSQCDPNYQPLITRKLHLKIPTLSNLDCYCVGLNSIILTNMLDLKYLYLSENYLTELDLTQTPKLEIIHCTLNRIKNIDISKVPMLKKLYLESNKLSKLDLSNVPMLRDLGLGDNQLTKLDLSNVPRLKELGLGSNPLVTLDLTKVVMLEKLDIDSSVNLIR